MSLAALAASGAGVFGAIAAAELGRLALARVARTGRGRSRRIAPTGGRSPRTPATSLVDRLVSALGSSAALRRIAPPEDLRGRLTAAGDPVGIGPREWMAVKVASAAAASVAALLLASGGPGRLGALLTLCAPLAGFVFPDFWLARLARARVEEARRRLPDMLDLLRVTVAAGVPPMRALRDVSSCFDGVLATECRRAAASTALGEPQDAALARLAERLPAEEVKSFAEAMRRARRHGLPLGKTLATLASRARHARRHEIHERAARAGPKIQLAVALLLVPSMLLMVAAVLASELLSPGLGISY
jgi:tight adherence protein C